MEINANMNVGGLNGLTPTKQSTPTAKKVSVDDSFAGTNALEGALNSVPDVRPEAVARAKELINDPQYPSADTVKQISTFLAGKLTVTED